jgi:hypothetical protein
MLINEIFENHSIAELFLLIRSIFIDLKVRFVFIIDFMIYEIILSLTILYFSHLFLRLKWIGNLFCLWVFLWTLNEIRGTLFFLVFLESGFIDYSILFW